MPFSPQCEFNYGINTHETCCSSCLRDESETGISLGTLVLNLQVCIGFQIFFKELKTFVNGTLYLSVEKNVKSLLGFIIT